MIYSIRGRLAAKGAHFAVVEIGGLGFRISTTTRVLAQLQTGVEATFFSHLHVREDALELYGFPTQEELLFFELLNSVAGVGPKSALAILEVAELQSLLSALKEGRPDLLTHASGIGRKTAERIVFELRSRVSAKGSEAEIRKMESDADIIETLVGLGYRRDQVRRALEKVEGGSSLEERLRATLKILGRKA